MQRLWILTFVVAAGLGGLAARSAEETTYAEDTVSLTTVALRVHRMEAMAAFYTEAFDARFREVETSGLRSRFGEVGGITLKLVPLRQAVDFDGYALHQLGFEVPDVEQVIALALRHGGRQEGTVVRQGGRIHAAVRDPDGNTIELYGPER